MNNNFYTKFTRFVSIIYKDSFSIHLGLKFLLVSFSIFITTEIYAQAPANDICSGAITLTSGLTCSNTTGSTTGATDNNETGDCTTGTEKVVWYKFVATSATHTITVDGIASFDAVIGAISGCGTTTIPAGGACTDATLDGGIETLTLSSLTIGNTYYIQVYDYNGDLTANAFTICVTAPPVNDICSGAILLASATSCSAINGSTTGAADNNETGDCTNGTEKAVWYKFVASSTTHTVTVDGVTGFDAVLGVISGCGSATVPTGGACIDATGDGGIETRSLSGLTIGNSYYIQVYDYYAVLMANGFTICVTEPVAACTQPTTQATIGAYTNNTSGTGLTVNWTRGNGTAGVLVVARLTSTTGVNPTSGTAYTANPVFGSGNTTGTGNFVVYNGTGTSVNVTGLTASTNYTFTVYEYNTTGTCYKTPGSGSAVSTPAPPAPANDACASAQVITPGLTCVSTNGTTISSTQDGPAAPGACPSSSLNDVWYSFTADGTSSYTINVTNTTGDIVLQLFSGSCASLASISCSDGPSIGTETIDAGILAAGTYRYRVFPYNGANAAFTTCVTYVVPFNPCASISNLTCGTVVNPTIASGTGAYGTSACIYSAPGKELIYTFTPANSGTHYINQTASFDYIDYAFKATSGGCSGTGWSCIEDLFGSDISSGFSLTAGTQYYIMLDPESGTGGSVSFSITCPTPAPANDECAGATVLIPGAAGVACSPTAGSTATGYTESAYGCLDGFPDDDIWYQFVATSTSHIVTVDGGSDFDAVVAVFTDCIATSTPNGGDCSDGDNTGEGETETLTLTGLTIGTTYYVNVYDWWDDDFWFGFTKGGDFTICITTPGTPPNDNCAGAIAVTPTGPGEACSPTAGTTVGGTDSGVGCDDGNEDDDVWYSFIADATSHVVTVDGGAGFRAVVGVYTTCGAAITATGGGCVTAPSGGDVISLTLTALNIGTTYYVKIHDRSAGGATFTICVTTPVNVCPSGPPTNDEPCNAVDIPLGTIASGNNACSTTSNEPAATPACWSAGTKNTVWFSFIAPAGGSVKIRTAPGSLDSTQIAVYEGTCGVGLTILGSGCNDNAPDCGATEVYISELILTGLTNGQTYYIAVDGEGTQVGTFALTVVNGSAAYPTSSGQECSVPVTVCNTLISVGDPGYQGIGFICDNTNNSIYGTNCTTGERGSAWYRIDIAANGTLLFDIVPNDYDGTYGTETDYDFLLWKIAGSGATTCAVINSSGGDNEVACNYDADGVTGLSADGYAPTEYPYFDYAYETGIAVLAGESYLLAVQNFSNSLSGFTLDFKNTGPGVINTSTPASVTWTGGSNTNVWSNAVNWGGCTTPLCSINALVSPSSAFQPTITAAMGTVNVKNLTIDPGATLNLGPNAVLQICENLTNNGTIIAHPTSTIIFNDNTTTHTLNGTLTGSSTLGNLTVTDVSSGTNCTVTANTDIELTGNFTTTNANSVFNLNGNNMVLRGNLNNAAGSTTFTNTTNSTITFAGTGSQIYSPNTAAATPALTLNNVVMNNTGSGVSVSTSNTPNMILGTSGILTLTVGKIVTPGNQEVTVTNTANTAVSVGNTSSYVEGNLRRHLASGATGSFDFPVGNSALGYQLANINFTAAAAATPINLLAKFNSWGGAWALPGAPGWGPECLVYYNLPYLNNGYWSIDASAASTGTYNATLHNRGFTNAGSASGWSIAKSPSSSPNWALDGFCIPTPSPTPVIRTGMSGFSNFSTIQSTSPLPVELTGFSITCKEGNGIITWSTASELNSKEFIIERSANGSNFERIGSVPASGNSNSLKNYTYTDFTTLSGQSYYRLKMVDTDGSFNYSAVNELDCESSTDDFSVYYSDELGIVIKSQLSVSSGFGFEVYDVVGKKISSEEKQLESGSALSFIRTTYMLAEGVYLIRINNSNGGNMVTKKVMVR